MGADLEQARESISFEPSSLSLYSFHLFFLWLGFVLYSLLPPSEDFPFPIFTLCLVSPFPPPFPTPKPPKPPKPKKKLTQGPK